MGFRVKPSVRFAAGHGLRGKERPRAQLRTNEQPPSSVSGLLSRPEPAPSLTPSQVGVASGERIASHADPGGYQRLIDRILPYFARVRVSSKRKGSYKAACPCCGSKSSLTLTQMSSGEVTVFCHRCLAKVKKVAECAGLRAADFFPPEQRLGWRHDWKEVARYRYDDEQGDVLYEKVRFRDSSGGKHFVYVGPDGESGLPPNVRHVLYRLPALLDSAGRTGWFVEGEKDADNLAGLGLVSTTTDGGAGGNWRTEYEDSLRGADVVILADNDASGRRHAERVADALVPVADSVRVVVLPDLPPKGDVTDWLALGGTVEELERLASATALWIPGDKVRSSGAIGSALGFLMKELQGGPVRATVIQARAHAEGINKRTLDRAKKRVGVVSVRERRSNGTTGVWTWELPSSEAQIPGTVSEARSAPIDASPHVRVLSQVDEERGQFSRFNLLLP